jgi:hypothetical protein
MEIREFGSQLLKTGDLDPVYNALYRMNQPQGFDWGQKKRWLLSYWCLYNCGVASYLSEFRGKEYWEVLTTAAENIEATPIGGRWPRGKERRHFRGDNAMKAVAHLKSRYGHPEEMVEYCMGDHIEPTDNTLSGITRRVQTHVGFGPWIGFKVADMLERVMGVGVSFDQAEVMMFKDPTLAALMVGKLWNLESPNYSQELIIHTVAKTLTEHFSAVLAPPSFNRPVNVQEVETVLCKWKSHMHGHYPVGNDIHEIAEGTEPWIGVSPTAATFLLSLKQSTEAPK